MNTGSRCAPRATGCIVKRRLARAFVDACHAVIEFETTDIEAIVLGSEPVVSELVLKQARTKRDKVKRTYLDYVQEHGC
jgi:hypothetical protein